MGPDVNNNIRINFISIIGKYILKVIKMGLK